MAQAEKSVSEKLKDLYTLQTIDSSINEIEVLKGELPVEVSDLEDDIYGIDTRIGKLQDKEKEIEDNLNSKIAKIENANLLIEKYEQQMDNVKNSREFESLTKEIEMSRLDRELADKNMIQLRHDLEKVRDSLTNALDKKEAKMKDLETKRVELKQISEKTDKEEKKLRKGATEARKHIEDRLLRAYDKIRTSYRNGMAVVTVERNSCGGCFNAIPPQQQLEIAQRKKILACEHCGRILVDDNIMETEEEAK